MNTTQDVNAGKSACASPKSATRVCGVQAIVVPGVPLAANKLLRDSALQWELSLAFKIKIMKAVKQGLAKLGELGTHSVE